MSLDKLEEAISLINHGQPEAARPLLIDFLRTKPQDEVAWRYLTRALPTIDQKIESLQHCLRLNPHSHWAKDALEELEEERRRNQRKKAPVLPPRPEPAKRELIPAGIFEAEADPPSPGIDWSTREKRGSARASTQNNTRPASLPGGVVRSRRLNHSRLLKAVLLGAAVFGLAGLTIAYLPGRTSGGGAGAYTPDTESQTQTAAQLPEQVSAATPHPSPTPAPPKTATLEPAPGEPLTVPVIQPLSSHPVINPGNAAQIVLLTQWFVDEAVSVAFSPDGSQLAVGGWDGTVWIWDTRTLLQSPWGRGQDLYHYNQPFGVNSVAFSPDGKTLAFGISAIKQPLRLLDLSNLGAGSELPMRALEGHVEGVKSVAFSPDGTVLASSSFDNTVRLWDLATGDERVRIEGFYIEKVAFSPDGKTFATAFFDHGYSTILWDYPRLLQEGSYNQEETTVLDGGPGAAFSLDGELFVTAEQRISIWAAPGITEPGSARVLVSLSGHPQLVQCLALSPDGRVLASGGRDRKIKLWDTATGRELITLVGHEDRLHNLAFSPDGTILASVADDGTVRLWGLRSP